MKAKIFTPSFFARLIAILLVIALAVFLYHYGKQHNLYIDNRTTEIDGVSYRALDWATWSVNGSEPLETYPRGRDLITVMRQKHSITIEYEDDNWDVQTMTVDFEVPLNQADIVVSLPAIVAGLPEDKFLQELVAMAEQFQMQDQQTDGAAEDDFTSDDMFSSDPFMDDGLMM